jgi:hypothetical protein
MFVSKVHVVAFFDQLDDLAELVHIQLSDERREVAVSEEMWEHFVLKFLWLFYEDLVSAVPCEIIAVLLLLIRAIDTSRMWYNLITN